jgi:hypothetical protein
MIRKMSVLVLIVTLVALGVMPLSAQDELTDNPLLDMLALVPNIPPAREYLSYIDYRALLATRPGAPQPTTAEAFDAIMVDAGSDERALLTSAISAASAGPFFFGGLVYREANAMPELVGFHIADIEQAIEFGKPTYNAVILKGNFNPAAIIAALERRGYIAADLDEFTLLCPERGCEDGLLANQYERNDANPFGGRVGRNEVVLLGDGWIASSPDIDTILSIARSNAKLDESRDHRAAAESLRTQGTIVQALFVHPSDRALWYYNFMDPRIRPDDRTAAMEEFSKAHEPIFSYYLLSLAQTVTESEDRTVASLVYLFENQAEYSAPILLARLDNDMYRNFGLRQQWGELMAQRGVTATDTSIFEASNRRFVLNVTFSGALASTEVSSTGSAEIPARPFALLISNYYGFGLNWLIGGSLLPYVDSTS